MLQYCTEPFKYMHLYIDGLVQERCNSIANTLELHLSCTKPSYDIMKCYSVRYVVCMITCLLDMNSIATAASLPQIILKFSCANLITWTNNSLCLPLCSQWLQQTHLLACAWFCPDRWIGILWETGHWCVPPRRMAGKLLWQGWFVISYIAYRWHSAGLQYLQCISTGDTAVLH